MFYILLFILATAFGCNVGDNDAITGLNPGCNFAGVCMQVNSNFSTCLCCAAEGFGHSVCGKNWICDRSSPSYQCYEFSSGDCSKVKQYLLVNLVFVTENEYQTQEADLNCIKWPGLVGQGVTSMLSYDLAPQVQYVVSKKGWPGTVKSRGVCDQCTQESPCSLGDSLVTSGMTFTLQVDLNTYYDLSCGDWIYDNAMECESNYDFGQTAYSFWRKLMGDTSIFVRDMNNLLQMDFADNDNFGKSWNNTKILGVRELEVITNKDFILTAAPTDSPTESPTNTPTTAPTNSPTTGPTESPTNIPTTVPSNSPTNTPTAAPTELPTNTPSAVPTQSPSTYPTSIPTSVPSASPTSQPSQAPTNYPTDNPTMFPTRSPTRRPTRSPTPLPTKRPTRSPTDYPTSEPTASAVSFYRY